MSFHFDAVFWRIWIEGGRIAASGSWKGGENPVSQLLDFNELVDSGVEAGHGTVEKTWNQKQGTGIGELGGARKLSQYHSVPHSQSKRALNGSDVTALRCPVKP